MQILNKIVTGGKAHKSRFHDEKGNLLDLGGFVYLPHCLATTALRLMIGYRPVLPWLSYRAINFLDALLQPEWKMLEWGSGMSTLWFAQRVGNLTSIEDYEPWYEKVKPTLSKTNNVDKHSTGEGGDIRIAEETLLKAVRERSGEVKYFVDLVPTYLAVNQGILVKLSKIS